MSLSSAHDSVYPFMSMASRFRIPQSVIPFSSWFIFHHAEDISADIHDLLRTSHLIQMQSPLLIVLCFQFLRPSQIAGLRLSTHTYGWSIWRRHTQTVVIVRPIWQSTAFRIIGLEAARHVVNRRGVPESVHSFEFEQSTPKSMHICLCSPSHLRV